MDILQQAKKYLFTIEEILKKNSMEYKLFHFVGMEHGSVDMFPCIDGYTVNGNEIYCSSDTTTVTVAGVTWCKIAEIEVIDVLEKSEYIALYVPYGTRREMQQKLGRHIYNMSLKYFH